ncbi:MAG: hypothetical protein ABUL60_06985 [Myxococcales bacterium]
MRLQHFTYFGFAAFTLALVPACEGGQTGDLSGEHGDGTETGNYQGCEEHKEKLAGFDTVTDSGTAEAVMAYAEKSFEAPITWKEAPAGQSWSTSPESGVGALHIDVARGANAYALTYSAPASNSGLDIALLCPPPQLGVEVHVDVTTDGGALAESYDTLLRTSAPGVATLSVPLDLTKLSGSLSVSSSAPRSKLVQVGLDAILMAEGTAGSIKGIEQTESGSGATGASSASGAVLAVWPDAPACQTAAQDGSGQSGGLGMPVEQTALGVTGTETLASVGRAEATPITWLDGSSSTLTVDVESTGDGCFRVSSLPVEIGGGAGVTYPVTISAKSADGKLDGVYAGTVVVTGSGSGRTVTASAYLQLSVDDVAKSGFSDVSVPTDSDGLRVQIESKLVGGVESGSVQLFSLSNPPCLTDPQPPMPTPGGGSSVPGCAGQTQTRLEAANF